MRRLLLSTCFALGLSPAMADDQALLVGVERYDELERVRGATAILRSGRELTTLGFDTVASGNDRAVDMREALRDYAENVSPGDTLIVAMSGRFITTGDRSWFVAANALVPDVFSAGRQAISIETVMNVMAQSPGRAMLVLAPASGDDTRYDTLLKAGIGTLDVPQGVTVVIGRPDTASSFMNRVATEPGMNVISEVQRTRGLRLRGFVPSSLVLIPEDRPNDLRDAAAEERAARLDLWEQTVGRDTAQAYAAFLDRYPDGRYSAQARNRLNEIRNDPVRKARIAEEALELSRDQRREIQRDLTVLEFNTRGIDGIFGPGTRSAITNWQQQSGFAQTSYLTGDQINRLDAQAARRQQELEAQAQRQREREERRDRAYWEETGADGEAAGLRAYLERYPDGLFAERANEQLQQIADAKRRAAQVADRRAWDTARERNTIAAYRRYLNQRPNGAFREEAEQRIRRAQQNNNGAPQQQAAQNAEKLLRLDPLSRRLIEARLDQLGLEPGRVDGNFDNSTRRAIRRYQRDRNLPRTGYLNQATVSRLLTDAFR